MHGTATVTMISLNPSDSRFMAVLMVGVARSSTNHFRREVFLFAVRFFILPWGSLFCREVLYFAVRFFFLPWDSLFCREAFAFAVTLLGHRTLHPMHTEMNMYSEQEQNSILSNITWQQMLARHANAKPCEDETDSKEQSKSQNEQHVIESYQNNRACLNTKRAKWQNTEMAKCENKINSTSSKIISLSEAAQWKTWSAECHNMAALICDNK